MSKAKLIAAISGVVLATVAKSKIDFTVIRSDGQWSFSTIPEPHPLNLTTELPKQIYNKETKKLETPPARYSVGVLRTASGLLLTVATAVLVARMVQ